ncbi:M48 family metallopeptidase [Ferrimonas marina]|uniref:Zn-dependent protease with chaperone function n=1 Tax=Ferrimonas marina TaxID=299255 RepID=A0A1M5U2R0_9GAMM|nr:M48 family metallopeptidase [Ferrimonas marina]SHH56953.1 Zn-dependent protease with chaperone function [Ferrimonas marina]
MNFFANQDLARRQSKQLLLLFTLAVMGVVAAVYLAVYLIFLGPEVPVVGPHLLVIAGIVTLAIGIATLKNVFAMRKGGASVAESLGAKLLPASSDDPKVQQLRNVLEEIALAAGTPVPPAYLIESETVNAFAAGYQPEDAVIGITRGALEHFSRDQLQAVIAHEYGHVVNGDARLGVRLLALVAGLSFVATAGLYLLGGSSSRNSARFGIALVVIGAVGVFFATLLQRSISRQREYLADATAVQFTRNPDGMAGALELIQQHGSAIESRKAVAASHLFFSSAVSLPGVLKGIEGWFSTHPPLQARIERIRGD